MCRLHNRCLALHGNLVPEDVIEFLIELSDELVLFSRQIRDATDTAKYNQVNCFELRDTVIEAFSTADDAVADLRESWKR